MELHGEHRGVPPSGVAYWNGWRLGVSVRDSSTLPPSMNEVLWYSLTLIAFVGGCWYLETLNLAV